MYIDIDTFPYIHTFTIYKYKYINILLIRNGQVYVEGLSKIQITNVHDLEEVLANGDLQRNTGELSV